MRVKSIMNIMNTDSLRQEEKEKQNKEGNVLENPRSPENPENKFTYIVLAYRYNTILCLMKLFFISFIFLRFSFFSILP